MPFAVKMGLNGTGFLGKKSNTKRAIARSKARRSVLAGFPVEEAFESVEAVREYLSHDKIMCLRCGKEYHRLGVHLQRIHGMTPDQYKSMYKIPWGYGLVGTVSHEITSAAILKRMEDGWQPPAKVGAEHDAMVMAPRRKTPFAAEISQQNLGEFAAGHMPEGLYPEKLCVTCGAMFTPKRCNHIVCHECRRSARAKQRYHEKRAEGWNQRKPKVFTERPCRICGALFMPKSERGRFCDKCRASGDVRRFEYAERAARKGTPIPSDPDGCRPAEITCDVCGQVFRPVRRNKRYRHCSEECRRTAGMKGKED